MRYLQCEYVDGKIYPLKLCNERLELGIKYLYLTTDELQMFDKNVVNWSRFEDLKTMNPL